MLGSVMHFLSLQAYSHSVAFRKAWLGSQEANRQLSHARAWESLSLSFLGTPMEALFNAPLLYHLSWNPVEATGTPESHRSGRRQIKKKDGLNLSPGGTPIPN